MLMERDHLTGQRIDATMAERCIKSFIKDLDPLKLFFYQSDVDEFMAKRDQLAELLKRGDIRFAYDVFTRFLARVDERIALAEADLNKPHDFKVDEEMIRDPDAMKFGARRKRPPSAAQARQVRSPQGDFRQGDHG